MLDVRADITSRVWDVGRTHPVAVGDRGEALYVGAHQSGDHLRLRLAELRELGCDLGDRAVVLAELPARVDH
jgi:hypothetical protein